MPRDNDQDGTPQGVFGAKLRYYRERAGLSQTDLAARVSISHDVISKIETGDRPPAKDFPERLDAVPELDTCGALARLWGNLRKSLRHRTIPEWFQPWADIEARATTLRWYEPLLVLGLLQTEDYARAILAVGPGAEADKLDDRVGGRISRQAILARANAPQLWSVVDEGVLHRCVGGAKVMHDQLEQLADIAENQRRRSRSSRRRPALTRACWAPLALPTWTARPAWCTWRPQPRRRSPTAPRSWRARCSASMPSDPKPCPGEHPAT
jgi:transcriptional regulator with XRE-family HTH domain